MKKRVLSILLLVILIAQFIPAYAEVGFSSNPDAIEQAAKSVLMLQVFDDDNKEIATGSGFVAFNNRTIITNYHVIEDAAWMMANSDDGYQYIITKVLVADKEKDIAICEFMSPTDLQPLKLNTDGKLMRAESIVAIGSPIGITNTVSLGNISALYEEENVSWIQFTAPISHGSSGGALFDDNGMIIGVTSASYIDTQNLNLAVHISEVESLYDSWNGVKLSFDESMNIVNATPIPTVITTNDPDVYMTIKRGDSGSKVFKLKEKLSEYGYFKGNINDRFDFETEEAVKAFNYQNFGEKSKIADHRMQDLLFNGTPIRFKATPSPVPTSTPKPYKTLKKGDSGEQVRRLQKRLIELGYLTGTADGIFGAQTEIAVTIFNHENLHVVNIVADNRTQRLLFDGNPKPYKR